MKTVRHVVPGGAPLDDAPRTASAALAIAIAAAALGVVLARLATRGSGPPAWLGVPSRAPANYSPSRRRPDSRSTARR